jgi:hypothetical protein
MKILVTGYIVRYPLGGLTWHYLQYILGLSRLGHDVYFLESANYPQACYDADLDIMTDNCSYGLKYLQNIMTHYNLSNKWVFIDYNKKYFGLDKKQTIDLIKNVDLLIDVGATCWIPELERSNKKIFVDSDPVHTQIRIALGKGSLVKRIDQYDSYFTYGTNIGEPDCRVPTCGIEWHKTRQPVVLDLWSHFTNPKLEYFTTVMSWSNGLGNVVYEGETYGFKNVEFQKFRELPKFTNQSFELAISGSAPRNLLRKLGWNIRNTLVITKDPWSYQQYIQDSRAEWSVARNSYVKARSGWFGDRGACYLASGKPVLLQETGYSKYLPTGEGLITFQTMEDIIEGINRINEDYSSHCEAARRIANKYFNSEKVLSDLLHSI